MKRACRFVFVCLALGGWAAVADEKPAPAEAFVGHWALTMNNGDAGWMPIECVEGAWSAQLWTVGRPKAVNDIAFADGKLAFVRQCKIGEPEFVGGPPTGQPVACDFVATVDGDAIQIVMTGPGGVTQTHTGKRLPPMPPRPDLSAIQFGEPVTLFNGVDLTGWQLMNPKQINGWKVVDGVLENESPKKSFDPFSQYGNLRTDGVFGDGKLTLEFNVPPGGNSGVYVRGAYEAQVVDRDSKMQGIQGPGAIFSKIEPSTNAGKLGGEWQSYEITIVDRHATVVLNGEKVIDNEPVIGNTNGAFQSDITQPGPHHLQGDHTAVKYRNIVWHPVVANP
tara:strand:- start:1908 stop:2915 length:1008 start_codon:yes stop_codon:yes gene_type:complete